MSGRSFEMADLPNFPMGKLCYDLVLEVIDELEPNDVPELMKADTIFRLILHQKPARIFGKQIHTIDIYTDKYRRRLSIGKFPESTLLHFNLFSHEALFVSKVERCSVLGLDYDRIDKSWNGFNEVFDNLKQVHELNVRIALRNFDYFLDCISKFKAEVTNRASFTNFEFPKEEEQPLLLSLISRSLQKCTMFSFVDHGVPPVFDPTLHSALSKTQIGLLEILISSENVGSTIELILNSGIPSKNKEPACFVRFPYDIEINNRIKNFPGIFQPKRSSRIFVRDTMMEMLRKQKLERHYFRDKPIYFYWKRIDEKRDCIYAVTYRFLFAKNVSSIQ